MGTVPLLFLPEQVRRRDTRRINTPGIPGVFSFCGPSPATGFRMRKVARRARVATPLCTAPLSTRPT
jgi:hypothetical protein